MYLKITCRLEMWHIINRINKLWNQWFQNQFIDDFLTVVNSLTKVYIVSIFNHIQANIICFCNDNLDFYFLPFLGH